MKHLRFLAMAASLIATTLVSLSSADAQTAARRAKPKPPVQAVAVAPVPPPPEGKCLRALNGACVNSTSVEIARLRALVIPAVRVSYFGTPAGTIGGAYIPFERFYQDDAIRFGLPTVSLVVPGCCVRRSN